MFARKASAGSIDLVRTLSDLRKDGNSIVADFNESTRNVKLRSRPTLVVSEDAGLKFSDQGSVARQNLHLARATGHCNRVHRFREHAALGSHYF